MRVHICKGILWFFVGLAVPVAIVRFIHGLGATTNLSDTTPWGFWIGFDVLGGVALAAGGFVIAASVHIFHLKKFKPILRPAILTAFLGYGLVATALIFDLGLPWNIWRPTIHWQHHSALFEVAWCVMLYLTVLGLEFLPVVLEKLPFKRTLMFFRRSTLILVIVGIMLSTLHQSSLGTLFLIMPFRLNPLWYSPFLPLMFFISAIFLGLTMVMTESISTSWLYNKQAEWHLLEKLAKAAGYVIGLYTVIRLGDLLFRGVLTSAVVTTWEGRLFLFEMVVSVIVPMLIFLNPTLRSKRGLLATGAFLTVFGVVLHRLNVGGIATITSTGATYIPSWMEFSISIGLVSAAGLVFLFFVENLSVYEEPPRKEVNESEKLSTLFYDSLSQVRLGRPWSGSLQLNSLIVVLAIALSFSLLPVDALWGSRPVPVPTQNARIVQALVQPADEGLPGNRISLVSPGALQQSAIAPVEMLLIDGNRNSTFVLFPHQDHIDRHGQKDACKLCHHMNKPLNWATPCYQCHSDMYDPTDTFDHDLHSAKMGGNTSCQKCHRDRNLPHTKANTPACFDCHQQMEAKGSLVTRRPERENRMAPGYMAAMHELCIPCHSWEEKARTEWQGRLSLCSRCHQVEGDVSIQAWIPKLD